MSVEFDFFKEFALDSRDLVQEIEQQVEFLIMGDEDPGPLIHGIYQNLLAIEGSAEFLGIEAITKVSSCLITVYKELNEHHEISETDIQLTKESLSLFLGLLVEIEKGEKPAGNRDDVLSLIEKIKKHHQPEAAASTAQEPVVAEAPAFQFDPTQLDQFKITITPEMLQTFTNEADEQVELCESSLLALEKNLNNRDALDNAFRAIHTLKGNCGLFGFDQLERMGHLFESILEDYRSGDMVVEQKGITVMLRVLDVMKSVLGELPDGEGKVPQIDEYLKMLTDYRDKGTVISVVSNGNATMLGEILIEMSAIDKSTLEKGLARQSQAIGEILMDLEAISERQLNQALEIQQLRRKDQPEAAAKKRSANQNIRVDLYKLDTLMNLVGELIIAENMVTHNTDLEGYEFENFKKAAHHLNRISRELQDISMSLRMIPIEATFHKMVRVVRDVSQKQNKVVEMNMEGEDTEVDNSVIEQIAAPLLHIIRNAIDHGIESPDVRETLGKPRKGQIQLSAFHEGGEVVLEIKDDGAGLNKEKILDKAREKGLIDTHHEFSSDQDIYNLIFLPGFSTAASITDISGRGVGMDVVRKNIERINGRVHINSNFGKGTTFTIRIPLTLAIIEGMLIRIGGQLFTIPLLSIRESLKITESAITRCIDGTEMVKIRDNMFPVLRLHDLFDMVPEHYDLPDGILIMIEHEGQNLCLFADGIQGQYQTVIKGLSGFLGTARGISGTSILSNGDISLILDVHSLVAFSEEKARRYNHLTNTIAKEDSHGTNS